MHLVNRKCSSCLHVVYIAERPVKAHGVTHNSWPMFLCVPGQMTNSLQWVIHWTTQVTHTRLYVPYTRFLKCCNIHTNADIIDKAHMLFCNYTTSAETDTLLHRRAVCCSVECDAGCSPFMFTQRWAVPENPGRPHLEALRSHRWGFWGLPGDLLVKQCNHMGLRQAKIRRVSGNGCSCCLVTLCVSDKTLVKVCKGGLKIIFTINASELWLKRFKVIKKWSLNPNKCFVHMFALMDLQYCTTLRVS